MTIAASPATNLNLPNTLLKTLQTFNGLVHGLVSKDLEAQITQDDPTALHGALAEKFADCLSQLTRVPQDAKTLLSVLQTVKDNGLNDDKNYMLEGIVDIAQSLPTNSPAASQLTTWFVETLWNNLQHPQLCYIGDEWKYRTADGSNNNKTMPDLGKAGSCYARTVCPKVLLSPTLPDPGLIFDELMARPQGEVVEHPNKISSMLFYLATIIVHDIFRTSSTDCNRVDNSSYLDLSPLYGSDDKSQASVRIHKNGLLKPDVFAEVRLLGFPPGVATFLISFNRFHNYIAGELLVLNEGGRFTMPTHYRNSKDKEAAEKKFDNDLFQTARLITCGLYVNVILNDYVKTILNLNHTASEWVLDPRTNSKDKYGPTGIPQGVGNAVSCEFNLIYRWHSAISEKDAKWTEDFFAAHIPGKSPETLTGPELGRAFGEFQVKQGSDPTKWTFGGLKRTESGGFKDADLVRLLVESTDDVAGAFGARRVPIALRAIEVLGMEQARKWNVATLNEFREFFGMKPHQKFTDINSDESVAQSLETLYGDVDQVELYPGLVSEEAKSPKFPGSGLCPGFTISKAILADAVGLVRGDRFYTTDYNATTLTNFGWTQIQPNPQVAGGGVLYTLLHRAYPGWYTAGSVYAMFPLVHPSKTREILEQRGQAKHYDFATPTFKAQPKPVSSWKAVTAILADPKKYTVPWGPHIRDMTDGQDYMLGVDTPDGIKQHAFIKEKVLYEPEKGMQEIRDLYNEITTDLINQNQRKLRSGFLLDIVAGVANKSHATAMGAVFGIPLKVKEEPVGPLTVNQFQTVMSVLFAYVFLDVDDAKGFLLRKGALDSAKAIATIVKGVVLADSAAGGLVHNVAVAVNGLRTALHGIASGEHPKKSLIPSYGAKLIQRFAAGSKTTEEAAWAIIPTIAASVATQSQGLAQVIDLLLDKDYVQYWDSLIKPNAKLDTPEAFENLKKVALECLRLATPAFGVVRDVHADADIEDVQGGKSVTVHLKKGDQVFTNFVNAGRDKDAFPDPLAIRLDRDPATYIHHGWGGHACIGREVVTTALATQLRVLARLKGLRRAPGGQGSMPHKLVDGAFKVYLKPDGSDYWPFPTTMKVMYDDFEEW